MDMPRSSTQLLVRYRSGTNHILRSFKDFALFWTMTPKWLNSERSKSFDNKMKTTSKSQASVCPYKS